jgi:hypothetical protein
MNRKNPVFCGCEDGEGLLQDERDQKSPEHSPESDGLPRTPGVGRTAEADYNDKKHESSGVQYCSDPVDASELLLIGEIGSRIARRKDEDVNR